MGINRIVRELAQPPFYLHQLRPLKVGWSHEEKLLVPGYPGRLLHNHESVRGSIRDNEALRCLKTSQVGLSKRSSPSEGRREMRLVRPGRFCVMQVQRRNCKQQRLIS